MHAIDRPHPLFAPPARCTALRRRAVLRLTAALASASAAIACGPAAAEEGVAPPVPPAAAFQPQELSIGEPISLPNAAPLPPPRAAASPSPPPPAALVPPVVSSPLAAGSGWLGIAVDDTLLTGRLVVVEVAPDGPAAKAGVHQQDVLLGINGTRIQTADEMAAALAAISAGQQIRVAIGRDNKVDDVMMTAAQRPAEAKARNWQPATAAAAEIAPRAAAVATAPALPAVPPATAPAVAFATAPPSTPPEPLPGRPAVGVDSFQASPVTLGPSTSVLSTTAPATAAGLATVGQGSAGGGRVALGVRTVPVDQATQSRFHMADSRGAFVIGVVGDLPAARAGVPPGSVIVALDRQPVGSPQELTRLVTRGPVGTPVTLQYVLPGGESRQASVVLQSLDEPLERALVGDDSGLRPAVAATLQATPPAFSPSLPQALEPAAQVARRPTRERQTSAETADAGPLERLEETVRRMEARLERLERRLERLLPER